MLSSWCSYSGPLPVSKRRNVWDSNPTASNPTASVAWPRMRRGSDMHADANLNSEHAKSNSSATEFQNLHADKEIKL